MQQPYDHASTVLQRAAAFLVGCALLWFLATENYWGAMFHAWPAVRGQVVMSSVEELPLYCKVHIAAAYRVADRDLVTRRVTANPSGYMTWDCDRARSLVQTLSEGKAVDVFYDPQAPQRGTLGLSRPSERGRSGGSVEMWMLLVAVMLVCWGAGIGKLSSGMWYDPARYGAGYGTKTGINVVSRGLESTLKKSEDG